MDIRPIIIIHLWMIIEGYYILMFSSEGSTCQLLEREYIVKVDEKIITCKQYSNRRSLMYRYCKIVFY